jgi:hypothetical protein
MRLNPDLSLLMNSRIKLFKGFIFFSDTKRL